MSIVKIDVFDQSNSSRLEIVEPPVAKPQSYKAAKGELTAPVFTRTLPLVTTTWFKVVTIDRQALAAEVRRKLGVFVQDWEAPGMEDYDSL